MLFSGLSKSSMLFNNFEVLQIIERLHSCKTLCRLRFRVE